MAPWWRGGGAGVAPRWHLGGATVARTAGPSQTERATRLAECRRLFYRQTRFALHATTRAPGLGPAQQLPPSLYVFAHRKQTFHPASPPAIRPGAQNGWLIHCLCPVTGRCQLHLAILASDGLISTGQGGQGGSDRTAYLLWVSLWSSVVLSESREHCLGAAASRSLYASRCAVHLAPACAPTRNPLTDLARRNHLPCPAPPGNPPHPAPPSAAAPRLARGARVSQRRLPLLTASWRAQRAQSLSKSPHAANIRAGHG